MSADQYILNTSMERQENQFIFEKREMIYTIDSNNGSYTNGQIIFDLASISNCGRLADFRNSTLVIPLVVKVSGTSITENVQNAFASTLKNHTNFIDSMSVQLSNHNVVELCETNNIPQTFRLISEMSKSELDTLGYTMGFYKDNAYSLVVNGVNTYYAPAGYESNNDLSLLVNNIRDGVGYNNGAGGVFKYSGNDALQERAVETSFDVTGADPTNHNAVGKWTCVRTGNAPACTIVYQGLVTLKLCFLNDFFDKLPLIRNSYLKLQITTNLMSRSTIGVDTTTSTYTSLASALSAKMCPYMVSQIGKGFKTSGNGAASTLVIESGIGKLIDGSSPNATFTACRLYTPTYTLVPQLEEKYFSQGPETIQYNAHFRAVTPVVLPNGSLNSFLVTNGLSRIRSLLIFPVATSADGSINNLLSPFSSCGTTTAPYAYVRNFNVRVGGSPHYIENIFYTWQTFQDEIKQLSINGGLELGLGSGLINSTEYNAGYRYIYTNLSRKTGPGSDSMAKSIHVDLINSCAYPIIYYIYVCYQKELTVDVSTGQLIIQ